MILVYEARNAEVQPRQAWQYSPGTRRVRRAPNIAYDNPGTNSDGLSTSDSFDGYNGAPDRYDWTFLGKNVRLVSANAYDGESTPYADYLQALHLNQDKVRYEKRRVWEFEAKLRPDTRHVYSRRVYHNEEDAWQMSTVELYDGRGQLWRVQEMHQIQRYNVPLCGSAGEIVYDLQAGRYLAPAHPAQHPPPTQPHRQTHPLTPPPTQKKPHTTTHTHPPTPTHTQPTYHPPKHTPTPPQHTTYTHHH